MKKKILFLDSDTTLASLAAKEARNVFPETVEIVFAASDRDTLQRNGGDSGINDAKLTACYDCIIAMGENVAPDSSLFPGLPAVLRWDDEEFIAFIHSGDVNDLIERRVRELYDQGIVRALLYQHGTLLNVVDSLQDGVIVHDLDRRVYMFSRGAERITGADRDSVIGRDCHELFQPRLCGESCAFCDGHRNDIAENETAAYSTRFLAGDKNRELSVKRIPLTDENGTVRGMLATITDMTRVHDLELRLKETESFSGIIGNNYKMLEIYELVRDLADSDFAVVISGESGTGKELVAAAIHNESLRSSQLFVPVNCGALPEGTLESELFGHVKGSFTGAIRDKKGRFELADKGTLFLDEIGDLSLPMQVKLLRVLQEGVFEPVGSETSRQVDVRVICATNRNLKEMVATGTFREDLYYRLAVVPIELPPLRDRRNDIPLLAQHFLKKTTGRIGRSTLGFSDDTLSILMNYNWPGNVRQLQNAIQFSLVKCRSATIMPAHLPPEIISSSYVPVGVPRIPGKVGRRPKLTKEVVERALVKTGGNKAKTARLLGVGRATLYNFLNNHEREKLEV